MNANAMPWQMSLSAFLCILPIFASMLWSVIRFYRIKNKIDDLGKKVDDLGRRLARTKDALSGIQERLATPKELDSPQPKTATATVSETKQF